MLSDPVKDHPLGKGAGAMHHSACADPMNTSHCWTHGDEPLTNGEPYIVCFECGHVYQTAAELEAAWERESGGRHKPANEIRFCLVCIHDFRGGGSRADRDDLSTDASPRR